MQKAPGELPGHHLGHTTEVSLRIYAHLYAADEHATAKGLSSLYAQAH